MKLRAIGIWNHSRLRDAEVEVREHLALVGPDDVGKSSVIRCSDFLLGASTAQLYARLNATDFRDPDKPLVIQATLDDLGGHVGDSLPGRDPALVGWLSLTLCLPRGRCMIARARRCLILRTCGYGGACCRPRSSAKGSAAQALP